jgi:type IV pilus assembly protein PilY1
MGGQVWRFDIRNGNDVNSLVTGGVLASLGNKGVATPSAANNRKFYYAPDVSKIVVRGSHPFYNIALGSGYRGHPLSTAVQDRFYSIRDYDVYTMRTQTSYDTATPIKDTDTSLVDVTTNANATVGDGNSGWKLNLNNPSWRGEKVLAESTTAGGVIFFPSFTPLAGDPANPCLAKALNRVYAMYASNARPFARWNDSGTGPLTAGDRFVDTSLKGIGPGVTILDNPDPKAPTDICMTGSKVLNRCVKIGEAVRSYWEHK